MFLMVWVISPWVGSDMTLANDVSDWAMPGWYPIDPRSVREEMPGVVTCTDRPPNVGSDAGALRNWPRPVAATPLMVPATSTPVKVPVSPVDPATALLEVTVK